MWGVRGKRSDVSWEYWDSYPGGKAIISPRRRKEGGKGSCPEPRDEGKELLDADEIE